ncbi:InlB B-repeat-containing protein [Lachnospiraceae bacterium ZAX-1]
MKKKQMISKRFLSWMLSLALILSGLFSGLPGTAITASAAEPKILAGWNFEEAGVMTPVSAPVSATSGIKTDSKFSWDVGTASITYTSDVDTFSTNGWDTSHYWEITTSTIDYENLTLEFDTYGSSTGPKNWELTYSINDGATFAQADTYVVTGTSSPGIHVVVSSDKFVSAIDQEKLILRLKPVDTGSVGGGSVGSGGTNRISGIVLKGELISGRKPKLPTVTASPATGTVVAAGAEITLGSSEGATDIYYVMNGDAAIYDVTNGDAPTSGLTRYTDPIPADFTAPSFEVKAIAVDSADDKDRSDVATFTYTQAKMSKPTAAPDPGEIGTNENVALAFVSSEGSLPGAQIVYTTDGTDPLVSGTVQTYIGEIDVAPGTMVKAAATATGYLPSAVVNFSYPVVFERVDYPTDGEKATVAEWSIGAAPSTTIAPATGGEQMESSNLSVNIKGNDLNLTGFSSGGIAINGLNGAANNAYWLLSTSTTGFTNIGLSFNMRASGTGPRDFKVQYSTDKSIWREAGEFNLANAATLGTPLSTFSFDLSEAQDRISNQSTLYIRLMLASNLAASNTNANGTPTNGVTTIGSGGSNTANSFKLTGDYIQYDDQVKPVTADTASGAVPNGTEVQLTTATEGATIQYSYDNSSWTNGDSFTLNGLPTSQSSPQKVYVKAIKGAMQDSRTKILSYYQAKLALVSANPSGGSSIHPGDIVLSTVEGATIHYTISLGGGTPSVEAVYTDKITVTDDQFPIAIVARATGTGYIDSDSITLNYTLKPAGGGEQAYFGQIHAHTTMSDGAGTVQEAFAWARDQAHLDFFAVTDHSNSFDIAPAGDNATVYNLGAYNAGNAKWLESKEAALEANRSDYVSIYGYEMTWSGGPGHINTFNTQGFVSRNNTTLNSKTNDAGMKAYYALLKATPESISQFNHPGTTFGNFTNFAYYDAAIDKQITLIEVGNGEGTIGSGGYFPSYEQYTMALDKGWHVAPTNNQDNHKKGWGTSNTCRTVIWTNDMTEGGLYTALKDMRVYASEVPDLSITYKMNGEPLGEILQDVPATANFTAQIENGTASNTIKSVSLITNGGVEIGKQTFNAKNVDYSFTLDNPTAGYYYLRVVDMVGASERIAVTAPVWMGKSAALGVTGVAKDKALPVTDEELTLTTNLFNNETTPAILTHIVYKQGSTVLKDESPNTTIAANGGSYDHVMKYTPTVAGQVTVKVDATVLFDGAERIYSNEISYNVRDAAKLVYIGIDASHKNEYVSGNYKDSMKNFTTLAAASGVRTVYLNTEAELIAATANDKYKTLILTAPSRRLDPANSLYYSDEEIAAVKEFAESGRTIIIAGWSDSYENYATVPAGLENHMAGQQNKLLEAIGSSLRLGDDASRDEVLNASDNYRLYFKDTYNSDNPLTKGIVPEQEYSIYGGSTVYAVDDDKDPTSDLPDSISPIINGLPTTWSYDRDGDGYGLADPSQTLPRYGTSEAEGRGEGTVLLNASEVLDHGDTSSLVIVSGGAFMSDFEIQIEMDNAFTLPYSNYNIASNLIEAIAPEDEITTIANAKLLAEGTSVTIEGIATSSVNANNNAINTGFFDSIYVQDSTAGINLFPISDGVVEGQRIRVSGVLSSYQGETQIQVSKVRVIDSSINKVTPTALSTSQSALPANTGRLVKTQGKVTNVIKDNTSGIVSQFTINDGSGPVIAYINEYITSAVNISFVEVGKTISVIGLASIGENFTSSNMLPRIRVRDRNEVKLIPESNYTVTFDANGGGNLSKTSATVAAGAAIGALPSASRTGYTLKGWYTAKTGGTKVEATTKITQNQTLYAQWEVEVDTVTFDANGGKNLSKASVKVNYGQAIGALPSVSRTGYTLKGWYTAKTGGTKVEASTKITKSQTLYAQWEVEVDTVKFDANGGTKLSKSKLDVKYNQKIGTLPTVQKKGYTLKGWYTKKTGGSKITSSTKITKAQTLYAQWAKVAAPKQAKTPTLKNSKSKQLVVSYKKTSNAKGYEISYSTIKTFSKAKTKTTTSTSLTATIKQLKKGTTYYVKVRAYKLDSAGNKVYGSYSKVKSLKLKQ